MEDIQGSTSLAAGRERLLLLLLRVRQLLVVPLLLQQLEGIVQVQRRVRLQEVVEARVQVLVGAGRLDPHLPVRLGLPQVHCTATATVRPLRGGRVFNTVSVG